MIPHSPDGVEMANQNSNSWPQGLFMNTGVCKIKFTKKPLKGQQVFIPGSTANFHRLSTYVFWMITDSRTLAFSSK